MSQSYQARRHIVLSMVSASIALMLAGCDSSRTPPSSVPQTPGKIMRVDKNAPVEQRVRAIVVEHLGLTNQPSLSARLIKDLGADSLDFVELIMTMEEEFTLEISDEAAEKMITLGDIVAYLEKAQWQGRKK